MTQLAPIDPGLLPEGTVTFLHCDIEGSAALIESMGPEYKALLDRYHELVASIGARHNGLVTSVEGDGVVMVHLSVVEAAESAVAIITSLTAEPWPAGIEVRPRIGLHTGRATRSDFGYFGLEVSRAAAIGTASNGNQVLVSAITRQLLENSGEWAFDDLGLFVLASVPDPERLSQLRIDSFAPIASPRARPYNVGNLPTPESTLVGRTSDLAALGELIRRDTVRMVTVTGPGGTGKTRLAIELGNGLATEFPGGIHFVDLSGIQEEGMVLPAIGRVLGILDTEARTIPQAVGAVAGQSRLLMILDNMEHLIDAGVELGDLLQEAPNMKVLVTSRVPLRVRWEQEYPLSPLQVPDAGMSGLEPISEVESVALFVSRAREVASGFTLDEGNASVIAEICRKLDGLPLAIELAAARLQAMAPEDLLERLTDRFAVLTEGDEGSPERHRTLRAAIEWSHDLLEPEEKALFRRLSVFAGGWSLEAAEWVCAGDDQRDDVLERLGDLVAKSLSVFYLDDLGEPRYRMLESLREFALESLRASGEEQELRDRHRAWCLDLAKRLEAGSPAPGFTVLLDEAEREIHNIREALGWAISIDDASVDEDAMSIVGLLWLFWDIRGLVKEGLDWSLKFLERSSEAPSPARASALLSAGWLSQLSGDPIASGGYILQATDVRRELGDDYWLAWTLSVKGMLYYNLFQPDEAKAAFNESIELAQGIGYFWLSQGWAPYGLGHVAWLEGDLETAKRLITETLDLSTKHELLWGIGHAQLSLSLLAYFSGDLSQAATRMTESVRIRQQIRDSRGIADCLSIMAVFAGSQDHELAAKLLGASELKREATGQMVVPWLQPFFEEAVLMASSALGEDTYRAHFLEGRGLTTDEAIDLALAGMASPVGAAGPSGPG